jgi:hypothetical protein
LSTFVFVHPSVGEIGSRDVRDVVVFHRRIIHYLGKKVKPQRGKVVEAGRESSGPDLLLMTPSPK